ncbi:MAG: hypothetical protein AAF587_02310 [Bacteroidota bacterium]
MPKYAHLSPYVFSENRVIDSYELEGLESVQLHEIPGEIGKAFSWAGGKLYDLGVSTAQGVVYLATTSPTESIPVLVKGGVNAAVQTGSDVGTIYGTFGQNLYSQTVGDGSYKINNNELYPAIHRQGEVIGDEGLAGIVTGGIVILGNKLIPPNALFANGSGGGRVFRKLKDKHFKLQVEVRKLSREAESIDIMFDDVSSRRAEAWDKMKNPLNHEEVRDAAKLDHDSLHDLMAEYASRRKTLRNNLRKKQSELMRVRSRLKNEYNLTDEDLDPLNLDN